MTDCDECKGKGHVNVRFMDGHCVMPCVMCKPTKISLDNVEEKKERLKRRKQSIFYRIQRMSKDHERVGQECVLCGNDGPDLNCYECYDRKCKTCDQLASSGNWYDCDARPRCHKCKRSRVKTDTICDDCGCG